MLLTKIEVIVIIYIVIFYHPLCRCVGCCYCCYQIWLLQQSSWRYHYSYNIGSLQRAQNCLVRAICRLTHKVQTTHYLSQLHWLSIKEQIDFKPVLLSWKALNLKLYKDAEACYRKRAEEAHWCTFLIDYRYYS